MLQYNNLFSRMCGPITARWGHWASAPIKTFVDQAVHHPICYFPFFFGARCFWGQA